jgi:hypothetical protein
MLTCSGCDGSGVIDAGYGWDTCDDCKGSGKVEPAAPPEKKEEPFFYGRYAFICDDPDCGALVFWRGSKRAEKRMTRNLLDCTHFLCPVCCEEYEIDEGARRMLK